jgi:anti-sigma regulatory factor (Ser/Thr protein kinase)
MAVDAPSSGQSHARTHVRRGGERPNRQVPPTQRQEKAVTVEEAAEASEPAEEHAAESGYRLTAPNTQASPKVARDMVASLLAATDHHGIIETARLLVSEVVTNVFVHTAVPLFTVEAVVRAGGLLVQVTDGEHDSQLAALGQSSVSGAPDESEHGRGLRLVAALASRWGIDVRGGCHPVAKAVWFELQDGEDAFN